MIQLQRSKRVWQVPNCEKSFRQKTGLNCLVQKLADFVRKMALFLNILTHRAILGVLLLEDEEPCKACRSRAVSKLIS